MHVHERPRPRPMDVPAGSGAPDRAEALRREARDLASIGRRASARGLSRDSQAYLRASWQHGGE